MKVFDWEKFWIEHPQKQLALDNVKWANLRPVNYDYSKSFKKIKDALDINEKDKVLEVGCGTGEFFPFLNKIVPSNQIAMTDISQIMIDEASLKSGDALITRAPAHILPFLDNEFDKTFCVGVIQYISPLYFQQSIKEMLRVLKVGGKIYLGDILEKADKATEVFAYPKNEWNQFSKYGKVNFIKSDFENRLGVVIVKTNEVGITFNLREHYGWGNGDV